MLALGVAATMVAGLTPLPALLALLGHRAFLPFVPRVGSTERDGGGVWRRIGELVARPRLVLVVTAAVLTAAAAGNAVDLPGLPLGAGFRGTVESIEGRKALARSLPAGASVPTDVLVPVGRAGDAADALRRVDGVVAVRHGATSDDGSSRTCA